MAYSHYDRLTALDATFLGLEDANVHMHVGSVGIFDAGPLRAANGALDMDRVRAVSRASLQRQPRFRQKLAYVPLTQQPVWVDDPRFNLNYHLRHTCLPVPGDVRRLKRLAGRIMSQKLDRGKPLWEMWFVDGVEGNRFAVISKVHHCMVDGISGVDLMSSLMRTDADDRLEPTKRWLPRPAPSPSELLFDEVYRRASIPFAALGGARRAVSDTGAALGSLRRTAGALGEVVSAGLAPASPTPLNPDIGPHRRFDWARFDLDAVKEVKNKLGGTINDVVLAVVSGAVRGFLRGRGLRLQDLDFRAMLPVSTRTEQQRATLGNRVSTLLANLPIAERDPRRRLERVIEETRQVKSSGQARGAEILEEISDWVYPSLAVDFARLAARMRSYNMVVTNVPGPPIPTYLLGAQMQEVYPLVPLFANQGLGVALFSYDGGLYWGFNADWDVVPDLHDFVEAVEKEFAALRAAAAQARSPARRGSRTPRRSKAGVAEGSG